MHNVVRIAQTWFYNSGWVGFCRGGYAYLNIKHCLNFCFEDKDYWSINFYRTGPKLSWWTNESIKTSHIHSLARCITLADMLLLLQMFSISYFFPLRPSHKSKRLVSHAQALFSCQHQIGYCQNPSLNKKNCLVVLISVLNSHASDGFLL